MAKMSIHRGLKELKLLQKRIEKAIAGHHYVSMRKKAAEVVNGVPVVEIEATLVSNYQSVMDLIARRATIKRAIVLSNAGVQEGTELRTISVGKYKMTVAEAIEYKNSIIFEMQLLEQLRAQYSRVLRTIETENMKAESLFNDNVSRMFGPESKQKLGADEIANLRKQLYDPNESVIIDPLKIKDIIDEMDKNIDLFMTDVDSVLSEVNATTFIDVE